MAQRRMFSRKITESDTFLDMPLSAQVLYFHVNMQADDDGFVGNVKTIKRMIGASDDDLRLLIQKEFLIPFESGVVVVKDWKIHNYIRKDRYVETFYAAEKAQVYEDESRQYQRLEGWSTNGIPSDIPLVDQMDTQVRLGKDRIGKDRLELDKNNNNNNNKNKSKDRLGEEKNPAVVADDDQSKNVVSIYQENFGVISPILIQNLTEWEKDIGTEMVIEAMARAKKNQKPYSYAEGIMKNWANNGIRTLDDVKANDLEHKTNKNNKRPIRTEKLPEWAADDYEPKEDVPLDDETTKSLQERRERLKQQYGQE